MVDLLVQTSLDYLLFILKILIIFFTKQATLIRRRSTVLSLPTQLLFSSLSVVKPNGVDCRFEYCRYAVRDPAECLHADNDKCHYF
jgi:hypothetical protein